MLESVRCSKMLNEKFMAIEANRNVEKFGITHVAHRHDILDDANVLNMRVNIWRHST